MSDIVVRKEQNIALIEQHQQRIFDVLPIENKQRFKEVSISVMNSPNLIDCTPQSLFMSVYNCAKMGLTPDPNLGHAWIVPYRDKGVKQAQVQIGYKGRIELAQRSGRFSNVSVHHWYENDIVEEYHEGTDPVLKLVPWWRGGKKEPGPIVATYALAQYTSGAKVLTVASRYDIEQSRDRSKSAQRGRGPWIDNPEAMALVVPIRMAHRVWPQTPEMGLAAALDRMADDGDAQFTPDEAAEVLDAEDMPEGEQGWGWASQECSQAEASNLEAEWERRKSPDDPRPFSGWVMDVLGLDRPIERAITNEESKALWKALGK